MQNNIKKIRKIKGHTQKELANHLGVSEQMVSMWEKGQQEKVPKKRINDIAKFLNVRAEDIFSEDLDIRKIELESLGEKFFDFNKRSSKPPSERDKKFISNNVKEIEKIYESLENEISQLFRNNVSDIANDLELIYRLVRLINRSSQEKNSDSINNIKHLIDIVERNDEQENKILNLILNLLNDISTSTSKSHRQVVSVREELIKEIQSFLNDHKT